MFKRIDTVFLPVRDLRRSLEWYVSVLGWSVAWQNECVACLKAGETPLTLLQKGCPGYPDVPAADQFVPNTLVSFNLYVPDIELAQGQLRAKGVEVMPITDYGQVKDFQFKDLDGNILAAVSW